MKMQKFKNIDGKVYKEVIPKSNKMIKRGFSQSLFLGLFVFMFILSFVSAGNVIVKEGDTYFDGNVGIGTVSPSAELDVIGAINSQGEFISANNPYITQEDNNGLTNDKRMQWATAGGLSEFKSRNDDNTVRIDNILTMDMGTGNVAIGFENSAYRLDVLRTSDHGVPTARFRSTVSSDSDDVLIVDNDNSDTRAALRIQGDAGANEVLFAASSGVVGIGTNTPSYPLTVMGDNGGVSIYSEKNISATGFITRTSLFDTEKVAYDYIKDANFYRDSEGEIDHSKFYGYTTWESADLSRPVFENVIEKVCDKEGVCEDVALEVVSYPHTTIIEGVNLESEINVLRQAVYEMGQELCLMGKENFC